MNIGTLVYLVFTAIAVVFTIILVGRYLYSRKHQVFIDEVDLRTPPSRTAAKIAVALAYYGFIKEDILKNSAALFDDDENLRSFVSFLTPDNIQAIKNTRAGMNDAQY